MTLTKFLNWTMKISCFAPLVYWVAGLFLELLGAEPLVKINTQSGYVVLILLQINLLVGAIHALKWLPLRTYLFLFQSRRYLGVLCGFYVVLHFLTYLAKESFLPKGWLQIVTKTYLIAGSISALLVVILTLTSNDWAVRVLKKKWKTLHRLVYLASAVLLVHIFLIEKANLVLLAAIVVPVLFIQLIRFFRFIRK